MKIILFKPRIAKILTFLFIIIGILILRHLSVESYSDQQISKEEIVTWIKEQSKIDTTYFEELTFELVNIRYC